MKIVTGIDFSERATQAAELAALLTKRLGGTLVLVHAIEPWLPAFPPEMASAGMALESGRREVLTKQLGEATAALRKLGATVEGKLIEDYADRALTRIAREENADLIVLGSHGLRAAERWLLGSVAEKTIDNSEFPVLVVPATPLGLREWLAAPANERPLRIAAAVDATRSSDAAVDWLKRLRTSVRADVTFASFYWPPAEELRLGTHAQKPFEPDPQTTAAVQRDLEERIGVVPGAGRVAFVVKPAWGRTGNAIASLVEPGSDMVVVGTHQRHGISRVAEGSVSRDLLHATALPVLFVPAHLAPPQVLRHVRLTHLMVATDLSDSANRALPYAIALLRGSGGIVDLVYVATKKEEQEPAALEGLRRKLLDLVPAEAAQYGVVARAQVVHGNDVVQALSQAGERLGVSAILVGSRGQGGLLRAVLGSVTRQLLDVTTRPVLVIPPERS